MMSSSPIRFDLIDMLVFLASRTRPPTGTEPPRARQPAATEVSRTRDPAVWSNRRATRRSRTGDLLITKIDQYETEKNQEDLSAGKIEHQD
jgi:hypothetical protein